MSLAWMVFTGVEALAIGALCFGIFLYRRLITGNRLFLASLEGAEGMQKPRIGFFAWMYIFSTVIIAATAAILLVVRPSFL